MNGTSLGSETFTDFDYADDVALLAELLSLVLASLEIFAEEAAPIDLTVNWKKTKI